MENPMYWTKAERVVDDALREADEARKRGYFGTSRALQVTNALRQGRAVDGGQER